MQVQTDLRAGGGYKCGGRKGCGYSNFSYWNVLSHIYISHSKVEIEDNDVNVQVG